MIYLLIQLGNIVGGFLLAAPAIERTGVAIEHVRRANEKLHPFRNLTGVAVLIVGILGILSNFSLFGMWYYGGFWIGFWVQALLAVLIGLILASQTLRTLPVVSGLARSLEPYGEYIGIAGIVVGIVGLV